MEKWYFHKQCGSNITLSPVNQHETAEVNNPNVRDNRVVFSSKPMIFNKRYEIQIEKKQEVYQEYARFGVCRDDPSNIEVPNTCKNISTFVGLLILGIRDASGHPIQDKWIFNPDAEFIKRIDRLGVMVDDSGYLHLYMDDQLLHMVPDIKKGEKYFAVFDLNTSLKVSRISGDLPRKVFTTSLEALLCFLKRMVLDISNQDTSKYSSYQGMK